MIVTMQKAQQLLFTKQHRRNPNRLTLNMQCVVQLWHKLAAIILWHRRECSTHDNEFNFVNVLSKTFQLLHAAASL